MDKMDEFRKYLRRKGKKDHVAEGLVKRCLVFEVFLHSKGKVGIEDTDRNDVMTFLDEIRDSEADINNQLRAIGLYFKFTSKPELDDLVSILRQQRISSARKPFAIKDFSGVDRKHVTALMEGGVIDAEQMLESGRTLASRRRLSARTGVPIKAILEFVKLSDLSRIEGVKSVRARLYLDAGVDTVERLAKWDPEELRRHMIGFAERTNFKGIPPLPKEIESTVETARKLPKLVEY